MYVNELGKEPSNNELQQQKKSEFIGLYESIRWTLMTCKVFGLMPISGLTQPVGKLSRFAWRTPYFLLYLLFMTFQVIRVLLYIYNTFKTSLEITKFSSFLLTFITSVILFIHLKFALSWGKLLAKVESVEKFLLPVSRSSVRKINIVLTVMTVGSLSQAVIHLTCTTIMTRTCFLRSDDSGLYIKSFAYVSYGWMYKILPFEYFSAIMFQITKFQNTFMWTFTDTLIIVISLYLVTRFEEFNRDFEDTVEKLKSNSSSNGYRRLPWNEIRQQYTRLTRLVLTIDKYINPMIFLSYSNIIFVGKQIYTILSKQMKQVVLNIKCSDARLDTLTIVYYLISVAFLLTRMILVSNYAARIHTLSRKPLEALYTVPSSAYDYSFQRFMDHVYHTNVSLSGFRCFFITREMIFTMLATLLTYEFMLLQSKRI